MGMDLDGIYNELRESKKEMVSYLNRNALVSNQKIKPLIEAELKDVESALKKIEYGEYGKCEISGELLPTEVLKIIPTVKSVNESQYFGKYCRKPIFS